MEYFNIKEAIEAQENYCREHELPRFAPSDGFCEHCCTNIYACHIWANTGAESGISVAEAGKRLITGCPHCNHSFVE